MGSSGEGQRSSDSTAWLWGKSGNIAQFSAQTLVDPDQGIAVSVLSNEGSAGDLALSLMANVRQKVRPLVANAIAAAAFPSVANASQLTGVYQAVVPAVGTLTINITLLHPPSQQEGPRGGDDGGGGGSSDLSVAITAIGLTFHLRAYHLPSADAFVLVSPPSFPAPCLLEAELGFDGELFRFVSTSPRPGSSHPARHAMDTQGLTFPHLFVGIVFPRLS